MKRILAAISLLIPLCMLASEYLVVPITLDDGLSQCAVHCVLRDRKGYLWIGTDYGLNRYDNHTVTCYYADGKEGDIPSNEVRMITMTADGTLLMAFEHDLCRYDYATDKFTPYTLEGERLNIRSARQVEDGTILGGQGKLYFLDDAAAQLKVLPASGGSTNQYTHITAAWKTGSYILATRWDGLWIYNSASSHITRVPFCSYKEITSAIVDAAGTLWVAAYGYGIVHYDASGNIIGRYNTSNSALPSDAVLDLMEYEGKIWCATELGLALINAADRNAQVSLLGIGPKNCAVLCLSSDERRGVYAGTVRHGVLCIYNVPMRTFNNLGNTASVFGFTVTALLDDPDSDNVWIGIDGEGIARFDPHTEILTQYPATDNLKVTSMVRYDADHILFATYNQGLRMLDLRTGAVAPPPSVIAASDPFNNNTSLATDLCRLSDGRILAVTDEITAINPATGESVKASYSGIRATPSKLTPIYTSADTVLVYDHRHIYRYDANTDTFGVLYSLDGKYLTCATYDGHGSLWVASEKGLSKHDITDNHTTTLQPEYIRSITTVAVEGDRVWVGADNKLYLLDGESMAAFSQNDGVAPNQFINKARLLTDDFLLLGGVNGMVKINRDDIDEMMAKAPSVKLMLSDVFVDKIRMTPDRHNTVRIDNDHSTISVNIIDHDNHGISNKLFRYHVKGFKRDLVIETFERSINLNMLPPGKYDVSVAYSMHNGEWSAPASIVTLSVKGPWWSRWWAFLLYAVIACAIIAAVIGAIIARRRRRREEMRRKDLQQRINFLTRVHADLRTPLTLIMSPLNHLLSRLKHDNESNADNDTVATIEEVYNTSQQMRDIIDALPETYKMESDYNDADTTSETEGKEGSDEETGMVTDFDVSPYSVLVVEDNEKLCSMLVSQFQAIFKKVETAVNATDAMRIIRESHPDLVVADVNLSGKTDGYTLCRDIKHNEAMRHIPVVLLTSGNTDKEMQKSFSHGADGYVSKPFDMDALIGRCKNLLLNRSIVRKRYNREDDKIKGGNPQVSNSDETFIMDLDRLIEQNISHPDFSVDFLAKKMALSRTAFYARMKQLTGKSIGQYIADYRLQRAQSLLRTTSMSISDIAEALGFRSQRYFSTFFKDKTSLAPSDYRNAPDA